MELLGKSREELREWLAGIGEPAYRGDQIYRALYQERNFEIATMTVLPAELRERLAGQATITLPTVKQRYFSKDGSVRYLFGLGEKSKDGFATEAQSSQSKTEELIRKAASGKPAAVEAVWMPSENRQTICISTQAGCAVDCQFCMTAQLGLIRNLTAGEIVGQILVALKENEEKENTEERERHNTENTESRSTEGTEKSRDKMQTNVVLKENHEERLNTENTESRSTEGTEKSRDKK